MATVAVDEAPVVVVHGLAHLCAVFAVARAAGKPLVAWTAPGAAGYAGVLYLKKAVDAARADVGEAPVQVVLDCGDDAAHALGALRMGWTDIAFAGAPKLHEKILRIAEQMGARLVAPDHAPALDLLDESDPETACRKILADRP
jgi:fructose/tagatose bisphosphate aldolase